MTRVGGVWVQIRGSDSISSRVRIRIGFGTRGSDSDRFRHSRFGFGSDRLPQVRIRIRSAYTGSDSDRRPVWFGFGIRTWGLGCSSPTNSSGVSSSQSGSPNFRARTTLTRGRRHISSGKCTPVNATTLNQGQGTSASPSASRSRIPSGNARTAMY